VSVFSHSRITSFENCPLQYRFRYIDGIKRDTQGIEAFMGKTVHAVLEDLYSDLERARASTAATYADLFSRFWQRDYTPDVKIVREGKTAEDYRRTGLECVRGFFDRHHPFRTGSVLGCEMKVEFALDDDGRYMMRGYVDRVDRVASGVIEIHDYKTGRMPSEGRLRGDRQLTLYEIALRDRWPWVREVRHVWHFLAHDKQVILSRDADDLRRARVMTIRRIKGIQATTRFPARKSALCSWCDYKDICPAWEEERSGWDGATAATGTVPIAPDVEPRTGQYLLF